MRKIHILESKLTKLRIKNFGILKDVETPLSKFNLIIGKNKIGKTTLIKALKCLEDFINNDVPVEYINFYRILRKISREDNTPVSFLVEFELLTDPDDFSGLYSYFIEVNLKSIQKEIIIAKKGKILKFNNNSEIILVDREIDSIKYFRMMKDDKEYHFESELRIISNINRVCTSLLWDESREPYMEVIRAYLNKIGGSELKFIIESRPRLIECRYGDVEIEEGIDYISLILHYLKSEHSDVLEKIRYYFKLIYDDFVDFYIPTGKNAEMVYMIEKLNEVENRIPAFFISDGTKNLISILSRCLIAEKSPDNKLVLIDEIENSLHPKIIDKFFDILKDVDAQLVLTTHSPVVLRYLDESDIKIMYQEKDAIKISQGYNRKTLAEDFDVDVDELDIIGMWIDGDDTDLIKHN